MAVIEITWQCEYCKDILKSSSKEQHTMNYCKCKKSAVDLEEYHMRIVGKPEVLKRIVL